MTGTDGFGCNWRFHPRARGELEGLQVAGRATLLSAAKLYGRGEAFPRQIELLGDGLQQIKVSVGNDPFRLIFFHPVPHIAVGLVAFYKNSKKTPPGLLDVAKERRGAWVTNTIV